MLKAKVQKYITTSPHIYLPSEYFKLSKMNHLYWNRNFKKLPETETLQNKVQSKKSFPFLFLQ